MLDIGLKFLQDYINQELPATGGLAVLGNITRESDIVDNKLHISLLHIEEEKVFRDWDYRKKINPADTHFTTINPELRVNLYVLFTYQYSGKNYEEALKQLSRLATLFQGKMIFETTDFMKPIYEPLQKISLELITQSFELNNNMWQALGEKLSPALLYKVRVIALQADRQLGSAEEITSIGLDLHHKTPATS